MAAAAVSGEDAGVRGGPLPSRLRSGAANLGLAAASLAVSLLLGEGLVRALSPVGPGLLVTDPVVGKRFAPGFSGRVFVDEAGREVDLRINADGFPGPDWPRAKASGALRLAVIGDSMTAAVATDEDRRFVGLLARALAARAGRRVEALNFGVSSASTGSELVTWRTVASGYSPDVVLVAFFTGNDLGDNSPRLTRAPRVYFDLDASGGLVPGAMPRPTPALNRWLDRHSRLYAWQKVATRQLRASARTGGIEPGQRVFARGGGPDVEHAWALTAALVRAFRDEVEATGARFALAAVPCAEQVDDALWSGLSRRAAEAGLDFDRDEPSRRLAALAGTLGVPLADLAPAFATAARRPAGGPLSAGGLYLLGRFHLSDEGHRVAAAALARFFAEGDGRALLAPR